MIELTIVAHNADEIQIVADACARMAEHRKAREAREAREAQDEQRRLPVEQPTPRTSVDLEVEADIERTSTLTLTDAAPATEAPKRRGRPPKAKPDEQAQADEAAAEAAEERAAIQAEGQMPVSQEQAADDIPLEPAAPVVITPTTPALTLESVRARAALISQSGRAADVKALLTQMGAANLSSLAATSYGEFVSHLSQLEAV